MRIEPLPEQPTVAQLERKIWEIDRALKRLRFRKQDGDDELAERLKAMRKTLVRQVGDAR